MIDTTLSHYKITAMLGEGGMGQVYRAEDTRLKREVALKVLPDELAGSQERLERFQREAEVLAALDHPNIVTIYSVEEADGIRFLTMQLVEGESLGNLIPQGGMPLERALRIGASLADAVAAAHDKGIVHRDLKPANVMVNQEGQVKVLDFGLARALLTSPEAGDLTHSPTLTYAPTETGVILGTALYMSPEQARGEPVESQADIWALGCVLYEMLTGERAFPGETTSDVLAAILAREPDWEALPEETPALARSLLRRCLAKDTRQRLHHIADARLELEDCLREPESGATEETPAPAPAQSRRQSALWALAGGAVIAALGILVWFWSRPESLLPEVSRFDIQPPPGVDLSPIDDPNSTLALSRNGRWVAFVGQSRDSSGPRQLYLRSLAEIEARALQGTDRASSPFFSPDGVWLGFWADGTLKKVRLTGGFPEVICQAPRLRGASWGFDGTILFGSREDLYEVSDEGGVPQIIAAPNADRGESTLRMPHHLPGGRSALVLVPKGAAESSAEIAVLSIDSGEYRTLLTGGSYPRFLSSGHLIYSRLGTIHAAPFDLETLEVRGDPVPVLTDVQYHDAGAVALAVSDSGSLIYVHRESSTDSNDLVWVDGQGRVGSGIGDERFFTQPSLSPDGDRVVAVVGIVPEEADLWIFDIDRGNWRRLTDEVGIEMRPIWSPDGHSIYFSSNQSGPYKIYRIRADGTGAPEPLPLEGDEWEFPDSISPDGTLLIFERMIAPGDMDILALPLEAGSPSAEPVVATPYSERLAALSPDGRWLAYQSAESDRQEVYVQPYAGPGAKLKLSTEGGLAPRWHPDGDEVFYVYGRDLWAVSIETGPPFRAGQPERLLSLDWEIPWIFALEVSQDPPRFLIEKRSSEPLRLVYVSNWQTEVSRLVAAAN